MINEFLCSIVLLFSGYSLYKRAQGSSDREQSSSGGYGRTGASDASGVWSES
jgi:hypothetical protein